MIKNKGITLIQLMVVIIVLGILALIALPNIKNIKNKSQISVALENKNTLQKGIDKYFLEKQELPTVAVPTKDAPSQIDWDKLVPPYVRKKPADLGKMLYWVDYNNTVWVSDIDAPKNLIVGADNKTVTWTEVSGAKGYEVGYIEETAQMSKGKLLAGKTYKELQEVNGGTSYTSTIDLTGKTVVISAISGNFKSVPVGAGYGGYSVESPSSNHKPVAVISMSPDTNITTATTITWGYENSTDKDGDEITNPEWEGKQDIYSAEGSYTIRLRVQDAQGMWSDWVEKTIPVASAKFTPKTANSPITVTPSTALSTINVLDTYKDGDNIKVVVPNKEGTFNPSTNMLDNIGSCYTNSYDYDIDEDNQGNKWTVYGQPYYGSWAYSVFGRDKTNNDLFLHSAYDSVSCTDIVNRNYGIAVNPVNGNVTMATAGYYDGFYRIEISKNGTTYTDNKVKEEAYNDKIRGVKPIYDKEGNLYIFYYKQFITYNALYVLKIDTNNQRTVNLLYNPCLSFNSNIKVTLTEDTNGRIWLAQEDYSSSNLIKYIIINKDLTVYKAMATVPGVSGNMPAIATDKDGNINLFYNANGTIKYVKFTK